MSGDSLGPATLYEVSDGVATITLDRAEYRNALSNELMDSLGSDLERAAADDAIRAVVLTNSGPAFSAGADMRRGVAQEVPRFDLVAILSLVLEHPKPVVGRIAGHAMGGGVGLAAACDISVASSEVQFGFTEVRRGVAPAIISVVCLPKLRRGDASELFLTGRRIGAAEAAAVGLINSAVPPEELDQSVATVVDHLLAGGPQALAAAKRLIATVPGLALPQAFSWTAGLSAQLFASEEAQAGMAAFRDRTDPPWVPPGRSGGS